MEGAALSGRPNTPHHAAGHPSPNVVEELCPFAVWRTFYMSSFGCGQLVGKRPVSTFLEKGADSDEGVGSDRIGRRRILKVTMGQVMIMLPPSQQSGRRVNAGRGMPVRVKLLHQHVRIHVSSRSCGFRPGTST